MANDQRQYQYTHFTPELKAQLLDHLAQGHNLTIAAHKCGIHRRTAYLAADNDPEFKAAIAEAREAGIDLIEDWMLDKARDKNGFLANIAWLKAHRRAKWGDQYIQPPAATINIVINAPSPAQLRDIIDAEVVRVLPAGQEHSYDDPDST